MKSFTDPTSYLMADSRGISPKNPSAGGWKKPPSSSKNGSLGNFATLITQNCHSYRELLTVDTFDSFTSLFLVLFGLLVVLPTSLTFWALFHVVFGSEGTISPIRWLVSVVLPLYASIWGFKRKSLSWTGALASYIAGFVVTMSSYVFSAGLIAFFVIGSKATKVKASMKKQIEADYSEGGQRNWIQVICNGGAATGFATLYMLEAGCREKPIDFRMSYYESSYALAVLGALACCCGDTLASELGSVWSKGDPRLITSFRRVPRGTNGGISLVGLLVSLAGGLIIGLVFLLMTLLCLTGYAIRSSPPQYPVVLVGGICGLVGSLIDSYLGALFQFSGIDEQGRVVNRPGPGVKRINGVVMLDNHAVNFISVAITALMAPRVGLEVWTYFV
ncbi:putative Transmembrane protein 19 [Hypsibius exemplaris]|uniref:Transmembrane protein 19 n=1 Tax=Hypsibius exemplaris TaxID=2072580 RepID=A0A1W0WYN0_HYPEX|nr:putative Transmembrane protein 19 [Hypsibius exemplaris]